MDKNFCPFLEIFFDFWLKKMQKNDLHHYALNTIFLIKNVTAYKKKYFLEKNLGLFFVVI
tara:strand:+ start:326 stop:505 length:180 start_codon:yes stop_codon:yes gene_type:complete